MTLVQPEATPDEIRDETGAQSLIGYVVDISHPDAFGQAWLDIGPQHLNRNGVLHGGIQSLLLDSACGVAGSLSVDASGTAPFLSVSMITQYVAPAPGGRVTAVAKITGGGRKLMFMSGELHDDNGVLIATCSGVYKRILQPQT